MKELIEPKLLRAQVSAQHRHEGFSEERKDQQEIGKIQDCNKFIKTY